MFRELVTADVVVADLSIHNANVFYELGIRHGMRPNATFLLRAKSDRKYPFDLQTDRYLTYDAAKPEEAVEALAQATPRWTRVARTARCISCSRIYARRIRPRCESSRVNLAKPSISRAKRSCAAICVCSRTRLAASRGQPWG